MQDNKKPIEYIVVVSDTHCGCSQAICPKGYMLENGSRVGLSENQDHILYYWNKFWDYFVPKSTGGNPYIVVFNGDAVEGVHHGVNTLITANKADQGRMFIDLMRPRIEDPMCAGFYMVRGTGAHVGPGGEDEERIAKTLDAIPDNKERHSRYELWLSGIGGWCTAHFSHHVSGTSKTDREAGALNIELAELLTDSGRWDRKPPNVVVRSHRHRAAIIGIPMQGGMGYCVTTPAWQLKTDFTWKIRGGRTSTSQIGGIVIAAPEHQDCYIRHYTVSTEREMEVDIAYVGDV